MDYRIAGSDCRGVREHAAKSEKEGPECDKETDERHAGFAPHDRPERKFYGEHRSLSRAGCRAGSRSGIACDHKAVPDPDDALCLCDDARVMRRKR